MDSLSELINALRNLPGVGPKSAQRMAFYFLQNRRNAGMKLSASLEKAMLTVKNCQNCNNFTDIDLCKLCQDDRRDQQTLCIVESPTDVIAIEQSNAFNGKYFVLMGKISPIDGLGPEEIGLPKLYKLITSCHIQEIIIALSPSIEGQTTIHFIKEMIASKTIRISQLAHGIPSGGELEFLDGLTIGTALRNRSEISVGSEI